MSRSRHVAAGLLLGVGLGGYADGIVLHQVLQWHHLLTATSETSLETNTAGDGAFHLPFGGVLLVAGWALWRSAAPVQSVRHGEDPGARHARSGRPVESGVGAAGREGSR